MRNVTEYGKNFAKITLLDRMLLSNDLSDINLRGHGNVFGLSNVIETDPENNQLCVDAIVYDDGTIVFGDKTQKLKAVASELSIVVDDKLKILVENDGISVLKPVTYFGETIEMDEFESPNSIINRNYADVISTNLSTDLAGLSSEVYEISSHLCSNIDSLSDLVDGLSGEVSSISAHLCTHIDNKIYYFDQYVDSLSILNCTEEEYSSKEKESTMWIVTNPQLDAHEKTIINVKAPKNHTDAVNLEYLTNVCSDISTDISILSGEVYQVSTLLSDNIDSVSSLVDETDKVLSNEISSKVFLFDKYTTSLSILSRTEDEYNQLTEDEKKSAVYILTDVECSAKYDINGNEITSTYAKQVDVDTFAGISSDVYGMYTFFNTTSSDVSSEIENKVFVDGHTVSSLSVARKTQLEYNNLSDEEKTSGIYIITDAQISANNKSIVNVGVPTNDTDAATKQYVDQSIVESSEKLKLILEEYGITKQIDTTSQSTDFETAVVNAVNAILKWVGLNPPIGTVQIGNTQYKYDAGQTFEEFVNSDNNVDNFTIDNNDYIIKGV